MLKLQFDAARYCRNNAGRMGKWMDGEDIAGMIADEIDTLRARVARMEAALQKIADGRGMIPDKSTIYMSGKVPEVPKHFNMYDMREIARRALEEK